LRAGEQAGQRGRVVGVAVEDGEVLVEVGHGSARGGKTTRRTAGETPPVDGVDGKRIATSCTTQTRAHSTGYEASPLRSKTAIMVARDSHCGFCGAAFLATSWPRICGACHNTTYKNPLPVAVLVVPIVELGETSGVGTLPASPVGRGRSPRGVDEGVLIIRRNLPPVGKLALPGGFIDHAETWQAAAARELREEAQIVVDPAGIRDLSVLSAPAGTLLVFGEAPPMRARDLPPFEPSAETAERLVVTSPIDLAFSTHTDVLRAWFSRR